MTRRARVTLCSANDKEARALHGLVSARLEEGHLLPRPLGEPSVRTTRFVVATRWRRIVGCAELAALSPLAFDPGERGYGVGTMIVNELRRRSAGGFEKLSAFTHAPAYFMLTPDCVQCPLFRACGQRQMVVPLESADDLNRATPSPASLQAVAGCA